MCCSRLKKGLTAVGRMLHVGGTNGFVGVLRILAALVLVGYFGAVPLAVLVADEAARRLDRLGGYAHAVGTDVGDQAHGARLAQVDALIELLHHLHGFGGGEVELAAGFLLQA